MNKGSITKEFNKILKEYKDYVRITKVSDNEVIILYEDYEHEPIINDSSLLKEYRRSEEFRKAKSKEKKGRNLSPEHKAAISKSLTGKTRVTVKKLLSNDNEIY